MNESLQDFPLVILLVGAMVVAGIVARALCERGGIPALVGYIGLGFVLKLADTRLGLLSPVAWEEKAMTYEGNFLPATKYPAMSLASRPPHSPMPRRRTPYATSTARMMGAGTIIQDRWGGERSPAVVCRADENRRAIRM